MLAIILQSLTALVCLFLSLHVIALIVMCYSASLTRPEGLGVIGTVTGMWDQVKYLYKLYWYNPLKLIFGGLNGIRRLKSRDVNGVSLLDKVNKHTMTLIQTMGALPEKVLQGLVDRLNAEPLFRENTDPSLKDADLDGIILGIYKDIHPKLATYEHPFVLPEELQNLAIKLYGEALVEGLDELNKQLGPITMSPVEIENRIIHRSMMVKKIVKAENYERVFPASLEHHYLLPQLQERFKK